MNSVVRYVNVLLATAALGCAADAVRSPSRDWASLVGQRFRAERDVVYRTVDGRALAVDLYLPYKSAPGPTVFYIHGGGWANGSKEQYVLWYLPYLELGMRVVAVQYRLSGVAPAPAAVEDCACALRWMFRNAAKYGIDTGRVLITGGSAGGHLALLTAFGGSGVDCPGAEGPLPRAAGVLNYYGPTSLLDPAGGVSGSAKKWLRASDPIEEMARRLSPLTWVRPGLPPVLTLHGEADTVVPYFHATRLHAALDRSKVPNQLVSIPGGAHGRHTWTDADTIRVQRAIEAFLQRHAIIPAEGAR